MIKQKHIKWIIITWLVITFTMFYMDYYIIFFWDVSTLVGFFCISIYEFIRLLYELNSITKLRVYKLVLFIGLFLLTFYGRYTDAIIEKMDWNIFYSKRMEIVELVKNEKYIPNTNGNNYICQLPYDFPIVSNGGNDIIIGKDTTNNTTTVGFYLLRDFFMAPSKYLIYTNDPRKIKRFESLIKEQPDYNWKLEEHWYRIYDKNVYF